jgi:hypothetical protein
MCRASPSPSCTICLEMWEPQPPGTLRACPGLYRECFTFTLYLCHCTDVESFAMGTEQFVLFRIVKWFYVASNKIYLGFHMNCLLFLYNFNQIWDLPTDCPKSTVQNFMEIHMVWSDSQTDMTTLIGAFHDLCECI